MIRRIELLQPHEQVVLLDRLITAFAEPDDKSDERIQAEKMVAAYRAIETVYERLDLPFDRPITAQEFNVANEQLGLDWRWNRVHRAWGSWKRAISVFLGGRPHSKAGTVALRIMVDSTNTDRRPVRESLWLWLETDPRDRSMHAYDDWARTENENRGDALKHCLSGGVANAMSHSSFPKAVEQVEQELATGAVVDPLARESITIETHRLVTISGIAILTNRGWNAARLLAIGADFPPWVASVGNTKLWLKSDVERWQLNQPITSTEGMYSHLVWDVCTVARRMDISPTAAQRRHVRRSSTLPPSGMPRLGASWWEARKVEAWLLAHPEHDPRQR